jgi:hypothetical protein
MWLPGKSAQSPLIVLPLMAPTKTFLCATPSGLAQYSLLPICRRR